MFNGERVSVLQDEKHSGDERQRWLHNSVTVLNNSEVVNKVVSE